MTDDTKIQDLISRIHGKLKAIGEEIDKAPSQMEHGLTEKNIIGGLELFETGLDDITGWLYWYSRPEEEEE